MTDTDALLHDHDHPHGHGHPHDAAGGHPHPHAPTGPVEALPDASGPGRVVIDIGGNVGAAVVTTPASLDGFEIEIRQEPGQWTGRHVAVRPRPLPDHTIYAAFFESLEAGPYVVRVRFGPPDGLELPIEVTGAHVSQVAWPDPEDVAAAG